MVATLEEKYTQLYINRDLAKLYPDEFIVRIFQGRYPHLDLVREGFQGKTVCEVGCGDGRNLPLLHSVGFEVYGVETTQAIASHVNQQLADLGLHGEVRVGKNHAIPFKDAEFDYLLTWNAAYYMGDVENYHRFEDYVFEFARVLKGGGVLVACVPMLSNSIYDDSQDIRPGYRLIVKDPYQIRNRQVFKSFQDEDEIVTSFRNCFGGFVFAIRQCDCFGVRNNHYIFVCRRLIPA